MNKEVKLIAQFFKTQGFEAIHKAILENDNAKANAMAGLNMWYKSEMSDTYIPQQNGTFIRKQKDKQVLDKVETINKAMKKLIEQNL